jgi:MarR family transcriptional regulator, 2-MHQ and catechol-resistance regulon repressor
MPSPVATSGVPQAEKSAEAAFRELIRIFGQLGRIMQPYFARFGISASQWGVLRALHEAEEDGHRALRLTDLGDRLLVRPPSVTSIIDRLQRMRLVGREVSAKDLRAKNVRLTDDGRHLVQRVLKGHSGQIARLMGGLDESEQQTFRDLVRQLRAHLENLAEAGNGSGN